jgi:hypothetical protein
MSLFDLNWVKYLQGAAIIKKFCWVQSHAPSIRYHRGTRFPANGSPRRTGLRWSISAKSSFYLSAFARSCRTVSRNSLKDVLLCTLYCFNGGFYMCCFREHISLLVYNRALSRPLQCMIFVIRWNLKWKTAKLHAKQLLAISKPMKEKTEELKYYETHRFKNKCRMIVRGRVLLWTKHCCREFVLFFDLNLT